MADDGQAGTLIETDVPARLDALAWGRFHTLVIAALGITWVLDGLEVTLAGSIGAALQTTSLHMSETQVGFSASCYLAGAVLGALLFGWLADRYGRKRLFYVTLGVYLAATAATALSWNAASFAVFRFLTGAGIGGEYTAINSAIQELIPARYRGRTDLAVNGSFWVGAAAGAGGALILMQPNLLPPDLGWRLAFGIGALLGTAILFLRRYLPESPRWLLTHGRAAEADRVLIDIERAVGAAPASAWIRLRLRRRTTRIVDVAKSLFRDYPRRTLVGLVLMAAQAFFYNAIFFTYALVLAHFFDVPANRTGLYILPFAAGNFLGPLLLGRAFDTVGRRVMIASTYAISGVLLALTAWLFVHGWLDARSQTLAWTIVFFFASAAASSAYLTVSESFPLEIRALAIALFYAAGTGLGGIAGPWLFGSLIGTGSREPIAIGYAVGALLMIIAAAVEAVYGLDAERKPLEALAAPLSSRV